MVPNDIHGFLRLVMVMVACSVANLLCIAVCACALFPQTGKNEINYFVKNFVFK